MAKNKKNSWVAWSEDEVKLLKKLFPHGRAREIAEQTERALTAVRQKAYSMGIKTREWRIIRDFNYWNMISPGRGYPQVRCGFMRQGSLEMPFGCAK